MMTRAVLGESRFYHLLVDGCFRRKVVHMLQNLHYYNQHVHPGLRGCSFPISEGLT